MFDKIKEKIEAALPKVANAAKSAKEAVVGAVKGAGKAVADTARGVGKAVGDVARDVGEAVGDAARDVGEAVGDVARDVGEAVGDAARGVGKAVGGAVESAGKMINKAAAAVPAFLNKVGDVASKITAAIPKFANAAAQKINQAVDAVGQGIFQGMQSVGAFFADISARNQNILSRIKTEFELYYQDVKRGVTQKGIFYYLTSSGGDMINLFLQMRKAVMEEYPFMKWGEELMQGAHQFARNGVIQGGDKFGNFVYNLDIPVLSGLVGGMFNASDMEKGDKESTIWSTAGSVINGVLGVGVLGAVDGLAGIAADPYGTVEGVNNIIRRPEEYVPAICQGVKGYVNDNVIEGSAEDRARVAGAVIFEVATFVLTSGGTAAAKAGDMTGDVGRLAKAADKAIDLAGSAKAMDRLNDFRNAAKAAVTGKAGKILASPKLGQAINNVDDFINSIRNLMNPQNPKLALVGIDDVGDGGYLSQMYDALLKKQSMKQNGSGVRINKAADSAGGCRERRGA